MTPILILKTGALGDVLRTTSILPGLHERYPDARITWVTAKGAVDLLTTHPLVRSVVPLDVASDESVQAVTTLLQATRWARVISLDDEAPIARLASAVTSKRVSGTYVRGDGSLTYTPDTAPWFDMGLLSVHGKAAADVHKAANQRSHPQILAEMLGLRPGRPALHLPPDARAFARAFAESNGLRAPGAARGSITIGLNTGAGGRWTSKQLPVERTVELCEEIQRACEGRASFLLLGGPDEKDRNRAIAEGLAASRWRPRAIDGGTDNSLLEFAALLEQCDTVVASDSLALHLCIALEVRVVAFFAPTSAAEIELFGRGEKVQSTATDYCSYRPDADNATITAPRLAQAVLRQLGEAAKDAARQAPGAPESGP